jgi:hypothetical protein
VLDHPSFLASRQRPKWGSSGKCVGFASAAAFPRGFSEASLQRAWPGHPQQDVVDCCRSGEAEAHLCSRSNPPSNSLSRRRAASTWADSKAGSVRQPSCPSARWSMPQRIPRRSRIWAIPQGRTRRMNQAPPTRFPEEPCGGLSSQADGNGLQAVFAAQGTATWTFLPQPRGSPRPTIHPVAARAGAEYRPDSHPPTSYGCAARRLGF